MDINSSVREIPLVGPTMVNRLKKLGIESICDLIYYFPFRYDDYSLSSPISLTQPGEIVTIKGQIVSIENIYTRNGKKIQKAVVQDGDDKIFVTWFNQPFLVKSLTPGSFVSLSGKIEKFGSKKAITSPKYEKLDAGVIEAGVESIHTGRLVPVYPETEGISSKWIRSRIVKILPETIDQVEEYLPENIKSENELIGIKEAINEIHFPHNGQNLKKARQRLGFDEFFEIQLNTLARKNEWKDKKLAHPLLVNRDKVLNLIENLPFALTNAQKKVVGEVLQDLGREQAMNRLLEGDVGSGKTVVAAIGCYVAYLNKFQSAIMSPTQILAQQHYKTLTNILTPLGVKIALITSESKPKDMLDFDLLVGTHALIQKSVNFEKLALIVIDEQHRFGVEQRALLAQKAKVKTPHILTMTATPIPRTVALTVYGDLDLSVIDEMPVGRQKVKTWVVPSNKRKAAYEWIKTHVKDTDEQAFIVCPLIEESNFETMKSVKAVTVEFERLSKKIFPDLRLGLLHGRMKPKEKDEQMRKMKDGEIDILVATPVVEVGIDIPNSTIMMIEAAERFGLSQLHQLRGRVGRGRKQSYCLLFTESQNAIYRLKHLENNHSGAKLAELDLKLRGPGDLYGTAQHGYPQLKIASYSDLELIKKAHMAAEKLLPEINKISALKRLLTKKGEIVPN